jgi:hypothetical protein
MCRPPKVRVSPPLHGTALIPSAVTALQARTFGVWTLTAAMVRFYAAFHIHDKTYAKRPLHSPTPLTHRRIYDMTMFTYLIAFGHFASELLIFRTAKLGAPVLSPVIVSSELISPTITPPSLKHSF